MSDRIANPTLTKRSRRSTIPAPTESIEQQRLFQWAILQSGVYPELDLLYHIPNGGKRGIAEAARFKREGVKSGVPDICLPVARGRFHGLYIELKRASGGRASDKQKEWLDALMVQGYSAHVCRGWEEAQRAIMAYLHMGKACSGGHST